MANGEGFLLGDFVKCKACASVVGADASGKNNSRSSACGEG